MRVERSGVERIFQRIGQEYASKIHAVDVVDSSDAVREGDQPVRSRAPSLAGALIFGNLSVRGWGPGTSKGEKPMKTFVSVVVLSLAAALATPAFAQVKEPKTKAECEKAKDMKWDDKTKQCVKK